MNYSLNAGKIADLKDRSGGKSIGKPSLSVLGHRASKLTHPANKAPTHMGGGRGGRNVQIETTSDHLAGLGNTRGGGAKGVKANGIMPIDQNGAVAGKFGTPGIGNGARGVSEGKAFV